MLEQMKLIELLSSNSINFEIIDNKVTITSKIERNKLHTLKSKVYSISMDKKACWIQIKRKSNKIPLYFSI